MTSWKPCLHTEGGDSVHEFGEDTVQFLTGTSNPRRSLLPEIQPRAGFPTLHFFPRDWKNSGPQPGTYEWKQLVFQSRGAGGWLQLQGQGL